MSKKLIAGAGVVASFAIALAPLATFAENDATHDVMTQVDTLNVTIEEVCAFGHQSTDQSVNVAVGSHTDGTAPNPAHTTVHDTTSYPSTTYGAGTGKWNGSAADAQATDLDVLYGVMENNTYTAAFGSTTLNIVCTGNQGYQLKANATDLAQTGVTKKIVNADAPSASSSAWAIKTEGVSGNIGAVATSYNGYKATSNAVIASAAAATTGNNGYDTFTMTYAVSVDKQQPAGTYTGTMTYTLVDLPVAP